MPSSFSGMALAALALFACSPRVIDAVVEGERTDGSADGAGSGGGGGMGGGTGGGMNPGDGAADAEGKLLVHRFSFFNGPAGAVSVPDSVSPGDTANIYNAQLTAAPYLALPGGSQPDLSPAYVDLPNFLISRLDEVTIEVWAYWGGMRESWQRIFDFGEDFSGADLDSAPRLVDGGDHTRDGRSYLYLTPMDNSLSLTNGVLRVAYLKPENMVPRLMNVTMREPHVSYAMSMPVGVPQQIDVTVKDDTMALYVNGVLIGSTSLGGGRLADIYDVNCWLGRSQFPADPLFEGRFYDFRIYKRALSVDQILANNASTYMTPAIQ